jgi:hypothetical protein
MSETFNSIKALKNVHRAMKARCYDTKCVSYKYYGAKGIKVSREWMCFETWYEEFGKFKPSSKHSIDRRNVNGNYCLENCRWATKTEQSRNRSTNVEVLFQGIKYPTIAEFAEFLGWTYSKTISRIDNYNIEQHGADFDTYILSDRPTEYYFREEFFIEGNRFRSRKEAADFYGVTFTCWTKRVARGMAFEEAMLADPDEIRKKQAFNKNSVEFDGRIFANSEAVAASLGMTKCQYNCKKNRYDPALHGDDFVAYIKDTERKGKQVIIDGIKFPTVDAACKHYGFSGRTVRRRMAENKMTLEEALKAPRKRK